LLAAILDDRSWKGLRQASPMRSIAMSKLISLFILGLMLAPHACADVKVEKIEYK
jgi:hypothetical protein